MREITYSYYCSISTLKWKKCVYKPYRVGVSLFSTLIINIVRHGNRSIAVSNGAVTVNNVVSPESIQILADNVMVQIGDLFTAKAIHPNAVQQQMLASHVQAMARRSLTGESLPDVDAELFEEISTDSMQLAAEVVALFGNLPVEESWLLSVHFEVARENK